MVYSEVLADQTKQTAAGFWQRAAAFFASLGVTVQAVMTDNGSCYRSHVFAQALGPDVAHKRTRPYRPQTNGKVERFNRTLQDEWAYARTYHQRDPPRNLLHPVAPHLQSPPTPHRPQRPDLRQPGPQPHREAQLVRTLTCKTRDLSNEPVATSETDQRGRPGGAVYVRGLRVPGGVSVGPDTMEWC